ncbi:hypothetical protein M408DRAFT_310608 [Serendipita vermifera MAFF 305830]|uniref:F-box domain-containing protein n=1 Tax=Serendipita vermifera MAFF 305830 TaxID=933852 RepID=A0A0C3AIZ0_SERVB|nr:hypothetical protein M408DRAFT_310608 [Serendipita vermifera MAFF 305830]
MSHGLIYFVESGNPRAVLKTPVEVWQEIIEHVLYYPIAFLTDPYYPGCNFHTAFNEWTDRRRLRKLEVQRGTLRLVSPSWRDLIDSRSWKYFEPYLCGNTIQQSTWAQSARRLDLDNVCIAIENIIEDSSSRCDECGYKKIHVPAISDVTNFNPHPFRATILSMPFYEGKLCSKIQYSHLDIYFPNVYSLFAWYRDSFEMPPLNLLASLTFLSICVDIGGVPTQDEIIPPFFALKTFHLEILDDERIEFLEQWEIPLLAHLQISIPSSAPTIAYLFTLLARIGKNLVRLCLRIYEEYVDLPGDFWEVMPVLEYFGTTVLKGDSSFPIPPVGHSLRTFAVVEEGNYTDEAREITSRLVGLWKTLDTIEIYLAEKGILSSVTQNWNLGIHESSWWLTIAYPSEAKEVSKPLE